ncbi:MAG: C39 family peptidase, partial [Clostridia bacterium]|nr:C39 family peptidase [Clostridia bacterium]
KGIVKFKVDIKQTKDISPVVYNVTLACDKSESALKAPDDTNKKLDVPYRRQGDVPEIGGSICSATSLSMLLLYQGEDGLQVEDVAWGVRDYGAGKFGNWAYNVAYAGELGYNAYIDYYDIDAIKYAIYTGHPVACSIKVTQGQLTGSGHPNYKTNGHLLCVVGYQERNNKKWLLINDPAHPEVKAILESEFETIYRGVSYIVQERPNFSSDK